MNRAPNWEIEGRDWPSRAHSRFVEADGLRWHVQVMGKGPALLLLHGAGSATHTWRALAPLLAERHTLVAPDLPGHGFTAPPKTGAGYTLQSVAKGVSALMDRLELAPRLIVGHSAGAAVGVRMALDRPQAFDVVVGINAALSPFPGPLGAWAPLMARTLFYNPFAITMFAARASHRGAVRNLIRSTGSEIDADALGFYTRLFRCSGHLRGTIGLMSHWDLVALRREIGALRPSLHLIAAENDRAVSPHDCERLKGVVADLVVTKLAHLGHLAHEEAPEQIAEVVLSAIDGAK